ncbi:MAG TPA: penicillin-binding protein 1C, partial [Pseudomonas sp.]|nr:penicillin-binding protein 1C [Pseudomonas sp.]
TPAELAKLYLLLAGDGRLRSLRWTQEARSTVGAQLLSPQAAFMVRDMLRHNPRPDGLPADARGRNWPVAWKTGTSWGFHDAWSAGLVGPYVLVVWVGNFDATPNPAFVGIKTAAPLFFRIADALPLALPEVQAPSDPPPAGLTRVEVCAASGELPNRWCPQTRKTWYIPGVSPIRVSDLHRPVMVDRQTGKAACPPFDAATSELQVFEFWPSDLQRLFAAAGLPRRTPPDAQQGCQAQAATNLQDLPRITSPLTQVTYSLRLSQPQESIPLSATVASDARLLYWFADQTLLGQGTPQAGLQWRPERSGHYRIRVSDDQGRSASRSLRVEFLP